MELTAEMAWVLAILAFTMYLFVSEVVRVDVAAVLIMVLLGLTTLFPATDPTAEQMATWLPAVVREWVAGFAAWLPAPLVNAGNLFDGFASNAVVSIIAVMIIGAGLDKTGIMSQVAAFIMRIGGRTERRIIPLLSTTVGFISSFMQNVGAAALFLPVVSRISVRTGLPMSRLLMPMGFCAILGGTITMIGSSPLILLNDLIKTSNQSLPAHVEQMEAFGLFAVTPIGIALVVAGILYFVLAGRFVLPAVATMGAEGMDTLRYLREQYGLALDLYEVNVPRESSLVGQNLVEAERAHRVRVVAMRGGGDRLVSLSREVTIEAGSVLAVMATPEELERFVTHHGLRRRHGLVTFADALAPAKSGIAEIVVPPRSNLVGKTARDVWMRKTYGLSLLAVHRAGENIRERVRDLPLQAGDTLICHTAWDNLAHLEKDRNFVVVTTEYPHEELRPQKVGHALVFFLIALGLVLFTDLRLSIALLVGAMGMIVSGVLSIDEAYNAVSWKTVFLLASLIPLGAAVETTGTAQWIAVHTMSVLGEVPGWVLQLAIAVLATFFTLVMSNVGATVLLVPLAVNIAVQAGANPAVFALTVALATSNSFLIPTHQVNALLMGPGGYRVVDFMRAGGIMTVLFLVVVMIMLNVVF